MNSDTITIVSGLPRSGTSMMMRMLEAGGMEILTDHVRTADGDNPEGYYEFERVKQIEHDQAWLPDARGRVVKMISALLKHLPPDYAYRVIFMQRHMAEVLASQRQMLVRRGKADDQVDDARMAALFEQHLAQVETWLDEQPQFDVLYVHYNDVLQDPHPHVARIDEFLGNKLDRERMVAVVNPALHRQRRDKEGTR